MVLPYNDRKTNKKEIEMKIMAVNYRLIPTVIRVQKNGSTKVSFNKEIDNNEIKIISGEDYYFKERYHSELTLIINDFTRLNLNEQNLCLLENAIIAFLLRLESMRELFRKDQHEFISLNELVGLSKIERDIYYDAYEMFGRLIN